MNLLFWSEAVRDRTTSHWKRQKQDLLQTGGFARQMFGVAGWAGTRAALRADGPAAATARPHGQLEIRGYTSKSFYSYTYGSEGSSAQKRGAERDNGGVKGKRPWEEEDVPNIKWQHPHGGLQANVLGECALLSQWPCEDKLNKKLQATSDRGFKKQF